MGHRREENVDEVLLLYIVFNVVTIDKYEFTVIVMAVDFLQQ